MKKLILIFILFTTGIYSHDCKEPPVVVEWCVDGVNKVSTPVLIDEKQKDKKQEETVSKEEYKRLEALVLVLFEHVIKLALEVERLQK